MNKCSAIDLCDRILSELEEGGRDTSGYRRELAFAVAEHCVCCGEIVPEGRMVCWACEHKKITPTDR